MCGFAGLIDTQGGAGAGELARRAEAMAATLAHRGPDDAGLWADEEAGVALGFRRLSIIDRSPEGRQPMVSASGRYVIAYNGEVYNFPDLRAELEGAGARFRGRSDTEVVLAAIEHWGLEAALERFIGMFAFALWDRRERRLRLVRDRLGIKPLYYGRIAGAFAFASELRALEALPGFDAEIDRRALVLLLSRKCVPAPLSIYRGIAKLAPGTLLALDAAEGREPRLERYWSLDAAIDRALADPFTGSFEEAIDALDGRLGDAVERRRVADVPVGVLLSGGIDSSTVAALLQSRSGAPVKTFTIGFEVDGYDESQDAAKVAAHLGTDHTTLRVTGRDALDLVPRLGSLMDEPFGDASLVPTCLVSRLAREQVTVALTGDGGDEVFGGYLRHVELARTLARAEGVPRPLRRLAAGGLRTVGEQTWDRLFRRLPSAGRPTLPGNKLHKLAAILEAEGLADAYRRVVYDDGTPMAAPVGEEGMPGPDEDEARWRRFGDPRQTLMYADAASYLPDDILTKVDRASMAVGLEARVPLLDHRLVEFAWSLPLDFKVRDGEGKRIVRRVLERYLPRPLFERPKAGFHVPLHAWLRGHLRDWAEDLLAAPRLEEHGLLNAPVVRARWRQHVNGRRDWHYALWNVLMFQAWLEARIGSRHHT